MTGGCTRWERWSPRRGQRPKVLKLDFLFVLAAEIIQVSDSKAWVRCASIFKEVAKPKFLHTF